MRAGVSSGSASFLLLVEDGALRQLEGFTFGDDEWPARIDTDALFYDELRAEDLRRLQAMDGREERDPNV